MKGFWKNVTADRMGKAIGMTFLGFMLAVTWVVFGFIAFGLIFQWILLLVVPKEFYTYTMQAFITVWFFFGLWYWFVYLPKQEK